MEVQLHSILTLTLDENEWSAWHSGHFTTKERTPQLTVQEIGGKANRFGRLVGDKNKSCHSQDSNPDRPACSLVTTLTVVFDKRIRDQKRVEP